MFGFSRGAFTIRTLVDLVHKQGLLPTEFREKRVTHREMVRNSNDAWRAFCTHDQERKKNIWVLLRFPSYETPFWALGRVRGQPSYDESKKSGFGPRA